MLFKNNFSVVKHWRQRKIAKQVRNGSIPKGVSKEEIWDALRYTKPKASAELFGFLSAIITKPDGTQRDLGLVSVKEVTTAFAIRLVDGLLSSGVPMEDFVHHKMGAGSTAETSSQTALVTQQDGAQAGNEATVHNAATHGATSNIYRTVGTLTAGSAYGCREHGVFNASTGGVLLDRSLVTNIDLNTDDVVTWTYELTVTAGS